jgi:hypothetical protein
MITLKSVKSLKSNITKKNAELAMSNSLDTPNASMQHLEEQT